MVMLVRKKTVTFEGATFTVASLTAGQVEDFLLESKAAEDAKDNAKSLSLWKNFILTSLNNAGGQFKVEDLDKNIDRFLLPEIRNAAWEITFGISLKTDKDEKPSGEASAS